MGLFVLLGFILYIAVIIAIFQIQGFTKRTAEAVEEIRRLLEHRPPG